MTKTQAKIEAPFLPAENIRRTPKRKSTHDEEQKEQSGVERANAMDRDGFQTVYMPAR
jgi:hypothetical protein